MSGGPNINLIRRLTHKCNNFNDVDFEAFLSPPMPLCGIDNFNKSVFRKGVISFDVMTSI